MIRDSSVFLKEMGKLWEDLGKTYFLKAYPERRVKDEQGGCMEQVSVLEVSL